MRRAFLYVNGQPVGDFPIHDLRSPHDGSERPADADDTVFVVIADDTKQAKPLVSARVKLQTLGL